MRNGIIQLLATLLVASFGWSAVWLQYVAETNERSLARRIPDFSDASMLAPCPVEDATKPLLRLLILGQSNAANHGELSNEGGFEPLELWTPLGCVLATDPLPGGSGLGGSIWSMLSNELNKLGIHKRLSLTVIAVDATSIADWYDSDGPLGRHLQQRLKYLTAAGWRPDLVLWQQGEADMLRGTGSLIYQKGFERLRRNLRDDGIAAPILLAMSTRCGNRRGEAVRKAIANLQQHHADLFAGPDTDQLDEAAYRFEACHFSLQGRKHAARLWAKAINEVVLTLQPFEQR